MSDAAPLVKEVKAASALPLAPQRAEAVFHWQDNMHTGAEGWIVWDTIINGVSGGGIFMHANATEAETAAIARNMTRKFTVCDPQIGGAKAGIRFNHLDPRAEGVLRRFLAWARPFLENVWVTAGDLNTDDRFIEETLQQELGLKTCQAALGLRIAKETGNADLSGNLSGLIKFMARPYFALIEAAVGYGLAEAVNVALTKHAQLNAIVASLSTPTGSRSSRKQPVKEIKAEDGKLPRVIIQGAGAVGSSLAFFVEERKLARVVAIADKDGFIHDPQGLPIRRLLDIRQARKAQLSSERASAQTITECSKNIICNLDAATRLEFKAVLRTASMTDEAFFAELLRCETAEVVCPCAGRYAVTPGIVDVLTQTTWKDVPSDRRFLVSGANNPYGCLGESGQVVEDVKGVVLAQLALADACVVCDWVGNCGTAQLFHRGLSIAFDLKHPAVADQVLQACAAPITAYMNEAFARLERAVKTIGGAWSATPTALRPTLVTMCNQLADERRLNPVPMRAPTSLVKTSRYLYSPLAAADSLSLDEKLRRFMSFMTECLNLDDLKPILADPNAPKIAYDGFEPSGRMHLAQGIGKRNIVNAMTSCGFTFVLWVADWFALMNLKLGGDLNKIQTVGRYFIEVWKAAGMDTSRVRFLWTSEEISKHHDEYWQIVFDIATHMTLTRIERCGQIMGRRSKKSSAAAATAGEKKEPQRKATDKKQVKDKTSAPASGDKTENKDSQPVDDDDDDDDEVPDWLGEFCKEVREGKFSGEDAMRAELRRRLVDAKKAEEGSGLMSSQIFYPVMQAADIFFLAGGFGTNAHMVAQLGMDQRKVHAMAIEYAGMMKNKVKKPVALHHHMVPGLIKGLGKASKSNPNSAIFMEDSEQEVNEKIGNAHCAPKDVDDNPCMAHFELIVFPSFPEGVTLVRDVKFGGNKLYRTYAELKVDYAGDLIHPKDLKACLASYINRLLEPVRRHFSTDAVARDLLAKVRTYRAAAAPVEPTAAAATSKRAKKRGGAPA